MKHIAKIAAFTAIFLIINLILCGFMPPDNGSSLDMWSSYHQKPSIDIAVIGSSLASCALPEDTIFEDACIFAPPPQQGRPLH